ncbi:MAG TPA: galactokinase [Candidatus Kapabacteria bacterium]|jgi:galactokinase
MVNPKEVLAAFEERFGSPDGVRLFRAPGRVNLIGEHTDYNDGFVLPVAIDLDTVVAARPRNDSTIFGRSVNSSKEGSFDLERPAPIQHGNWLNYVEGTARMLQKQGFHISGADLVLKSDVPIGAGLSSSASLEISVAMALVLLGHQPLDRREMALAAQQGEHEYTGAMIGIMDQFISAMGEEGFALLIDCRTLETEEIPVDTRKHALLVCDTGTKHDLAASEYNKRREECAEAVREIQKLLPNVQALRDVSVKQFREIETTLPAILRKRAGHVITENARTLAAAEALRRGSYEEMGELMYASHESLRNDYEVSTKELNFLVETSRSIPGVFGSRMTGGGFGGCTVSLLLSERKEEFFDRMKQAYRKGVGRELTIYAVSTANGAEEIET